MVEVYHLAGYDLVSFEKKLNQLIPFHQAESWDNVGLQVANENSKIRKVLLALDLNLPVLNFAKNHHFNLILSHHPLIFKSLNNIVAFRHYKGNLIKQLILNNIALMSLHTNMDKFFFNLISKKLQLIKIKPFQKEGFGSYGYLKKPMKLIELIKFIKQKLKIEKMIYNGDEKKRVKCIASVGGGGNAFITEELRKKQIDVLITSDIKYHSFQLAEEMDISVIDAGHFGTENIMMTELKKYLQKKFNDQISFDICHINTNPIKFN